MQRKCHLIQPGPEPKNSALPMNNKRISPSPFDFLVEQTEIHQDVWKTLFLLTDSNVEDNKQLKFISQTTERAIYTEKGNFLLAVTKRTERKEKMFSVLDTAAVALIAVVTSAVLASYCHEIKSLKIK